MNNLFFSSNREDKEVFYTVQKGDSLYKIASTYHTTPETLMEINHLHNHILIVGQVLKIVSPFSTPEHIGKDICDTSSFSQETIPAEKYDSYIVKSGDSLYKIAQQYHTSVGDLLYINDLSNTVLMLGQTLRVPKQSSMSNEFYTVQKGDTLWKLASTFHTTTASLMKKNKLSNTQLSIGQKLII